MDKRSDDDAVRYGGVITFASFALVIEGITRFILNDPSKDYDTLTEWELNAIVCSVFLVTFGGVGLYVGLAALCFDNNDIETTTIALLLQASMGLVTFISFVFVEPIYKFEKGIEPPTFPVLNPLTHVEEQRSIAFGAVFSLFSLSACTQGLQFFYTYLLYRNQNGDPITYGSSWNIVRAFFFFAILIGGIGIVTQGSIAIDKYGGSKIKEDFIVYPNFIKLDVITNLSGIILLIYAIFFFFTFLDNIFVIGVNMWCGFTLLWFWSAFILANISYFRNPFYGGQAAIITALSTVTIFSPVVISNDFIRMENDIREEAKPNRLEQEEKQHEVHQYSSRLHNAQTI
jgi:hypothetical protein